MNWWRMVPRALNWLMTTPPFVVHLLTGVYNCSALVISHLQPDGNCHKGFREVMLMNRFHSYSKVQKQ